MASLLSIVAALLVGLLAGWLIWGRILVNRRSAAAESAPATVVAAPVETTTTEPAEATAEPVAADSSGSTTDTEPVAPAVADSPAEPVAETEPVADTEPVTVAEAEPVTDTEPVTVTEPFAHNEPVAEAEPIAHPEPVVTPASTDDTEVVAHPEPAVTAASTADPVTEPAAVVAATPDVEPAVAEPAVAEPAVAEPAASEPAASEPAASEPAAAEPVTGEPVTGGDKLTRIEGIGPKIAATLAAAGIATYRELADTDLATLRATIKAAKLRLSPNLATWPAQARLLAEGDQRGFTALADDLAADRAPGVEPIAPTSATVADEPALAADFAPAADLAPGAEPDAEPTPEPEPVSSVDTVPAQRTPEVTETATETGAETAVVPDDLTRVEGIGPKMAAALITAGITTFHQLAATDEAGLRAAIAAAGMRFSPSLVTWPEQAKLLADRGAVRN